jgi:hypothetical protein
MYNFALSENQISRLDGWATAQNIKALEQEKANPPLTVPAPMLEAAWERGSAYSGGIAGHLEFKFTPTNLGTLIVVRNVHTHDELDLTDYESW